MTTNLLLLGATCAAFVLCAFLREDAWDRRLLALVALPVGAGILLLRTQIENGSFEGAIRAIALLNMVILVVTLGRPTLMFDVDSDGEDDDRLPTHQSAEGHRLASRVARSQLLFLTVVAVGVIAYEVLGLTFLD